MIPLKPQTNSPPKAVEPNNRSVTPKPAQQTIQLIIGLGNPDADYQNTRHNAGRWFIDSLANQYQGQWQLKPSLQGMLTTITVNDYQVRLIKPTSYMNLNGLCVQRTLQFYKCNPAQCLIVHDDLAIPNGQIRLKLSGGHGGHNGLRDVINHLHTQQFARLRVGISHPGSAHAVDSYVLSPPTQTQRQLIEQAIVQGCHLIEPLITGQWSLIQNQLHTDHGI